MQQAPLRMKWQFTQKPANDDSLNFEIEGRGARTEESYEAQNENYQQPSKRHGCIKNIVVMRSHKPKW